MEKTSDGKANTNSGGATDAANVARTAKLLRLLRSVRILRVVRALKWVKKLGKRSMSFPCLPAFIETYITTIIKAMWNLKPFLKLMGGILIIFGIIGCSLFGRILPSQFGNMMLTFFTLFQLLTLDDWFEILQERSIALSFIDRLSIINPFLDLTSRKALLTGSIRALMARLSTSLF